MVAKFDLSSFLGGFLGPRPPTSSTVCPLKSCTESNESVNQNWQRTSNSSPSLTFSHSPPRQSVKFRSYLLRKTCSLNSQWESLHGLHPVIDRCMNDSICVWICNLRGLKRETSETMATEAKLRSPQSKQNLIVPVFHSQGVRHSLARPRPRRLPEPQSAVPPWPLCSTSSECCQ